MAGEYVEFSELTETTSAAANDELLLQQSGGTKRIKKSNFTSDMAKGSDLEAIANKIPSDATSENKLVSTTQLNGSLTEYDTSTEVTEKINTALSQCIKCLKYTTSITPTSTGEVTSHVNIDASNINTVMGVSITQIFGVNTGAWTGRISQILTTEQIKSQSKLIIQGYGITNNQTYNIEVAVFYI